MAKYYNTGIAGKDAIEASVRYCKDAGGYIAQFLVGDRSFGDGLFGWHIDADYFRYFQNRDRVLLVPAARRSAKKEAEANALFAAQADALVQLFAAEAERAGAPHMTITAA